MKNFVLQLILLLGFSAIGFSQDYPIKFLNMSNGLSNNSVNSVFQDSDGYMWFGTYDGLNRYDGYDFKVYRNRPNDKKSLLFNTISNIEGDSKKKHLGWCNYKFPRAFFEERRKMLCALLWLCQYFALLFLFKKGFKIFFLLDLGKSY